MRLNPTAFDHGLMELCATAPVPDTGWVVHNTTQVGAWLCNALRQSQENLGQYLTSRNVRQKWTEPLGDRQMRDDGITHLLVRQLCQHRCLHRSHNFACLGTYHREA